MPRMFVMTALLSMVLLQAACSLKPVASRVPGYLTTPKGTLLMNEQGQCWRTAEWQPRLAITECDPEIVRAREAEEAAAEKEKLAEKERAEEQAVDDSGPHPGTEPAGYVFVSPEEMQKLVDAGATPEEARKTLTQRALALSKPVVTRTEVVFAPLVLNSDTSFRFNDDQLTVEGRDAVIEMAGILKRRKASDLKITVVGHTDRIGSVKRNQELSRRRAAAVKAALVAEGIPASVIETAGMGASMPVTQPDECPNRLVKCELIECLRPDRRVEIRTRGKAPSGTRTVPMESSQIQSDELPLSFPRTQKLRGHSAAEAVCRA